MRVFFEVLFIIIVVAVVASQFLFTTTTTPQPFNYCECNERGSCVYQPHGGLIAR